VVTVTKIPLQECILKGRGKSELKGVLKLGKGFVFALFRVFNGTVKNVGRERHDEIDVPGQGFIYRN
jgi:hypothetical protein